MPDNRPHDYIPFTPEEFEAAGAAFSDDAFEHTYMKHVNHQSIEDEWWLGIVMNNNHERIIFFCSQTDILVDPDFSSNPVEDRTFEPTPEGFSKAIALVEAEAKKKKGKSRIGAANALKKAQELAQEREEATA